MYSRRKTKRATKRKTIVQKTCKYIFFKEYFCLAFPRILFINSSVFLLKISTVSKIGTKILSSFQKLLKFKSLKIFNLSINGVLILSQSLGLVQNGSTFVNIVLSRNVGFTEYLGRGKLADHPVL